MRIMSTIKSVIIFVLSIALALETGFAVVGAGVLSILHEEQKQANERRRTRVHYSDYFNRRESS